MHHSCLYSIVPFHAHDPRSQLNSHCFSQYPLGKKKETEGPDSLQHSGKRYGSVAAADALMDVDGQSGATLVLSRVQARSTFRRFLLQHIVGFYFWPDVSELFAPKTRSELPNPLAWAYYSNLPQACSTRNLPPHHMRIAWLHGSFSSSLVAHDRYVFLGSSITLSAAEANQRPGWGEYDRRRDNG